MIAGALLVAVSLAAAEVHPTAEETARWLDRRNWPEGAPNAWYVQRPGSTLRSPGGEKDILPGVDVELGGTNEPMSAVSPFDPDLVATASAWAIRVSTDGGKTFQPEVGYTLPGGWSPCGDSALGYDSRGRLFWTFLGCSGGGADIFLAQCSPSTGQVLAGYPVNVTASPGVNLPAASGHFHDKEWLAVDANPASPFADRLYLAWTDFAGPERRVYSVWSSDQGLSWSAATRLSIAAEGFPWPAHNAVAPNGDYYVAYHAQPTFVSGTPDGSTGQQVVFRSTDGGATFPQRSLAFGPGQADTTYNVQGNPDPIPGTQFWLQGSLQPILFADPFTPGRIYVVSTDDPDNDHSNAVHSQVFIAISSDFGQTWGTPRRIDGNPPGTFAVMPAAGIGPDSGEIVITFYTNRNNQRNADGRFRLDVFAVSSIDAGQTFTIPIQINDRSFDPDPGAPWRYNPPPTTRIGEYNHIALGPCFSLPVWCGNTMSGSTPVGQQMVADTPTSSGGPPAAVGNSLRAARISSDVDLQWSRVASRFNLHRTAAKTDLEKTSYVAPVLNTAPITEAYSDSGAVPGAPGELRFYEAFVADCSGASVIR